MLSSSFEYLQALREGNYLRFLEWPHFVAQNYNEEGCIQDADETLSLLTFDWLNNGFCEEDVKKLAVLSAVHDLESKPLRGNLAYSFTAISIVAIQCMVYLSNKLQAHFISKEKMTRSDVHKLILANMKLLDESVFSDNLKIQQERFYSWAKIEDKSRVDAVCRQISSIAELRYILEDYITVLDAIELSNDQLKMTRTSVVKKLAVYLNEQTELTIEVSEQIATYVNKIRDMQPADFEEKFLEGISPLPIADITWRFLTGVGVRFFNMLHGPKSSDVAITSASNGTHLT